MDINIVRLLRCSQVKTQTLRRQHRGWRLHTRQAVVVEQKIINADNQDSKKSRENFVGSQKTATFAAIREPPAPAGSR
ncbi:MAG: hypothetical protein IKR25_07440 [Muribaculaceae bacterium]|nr:hypothetical protein [Muribaculaceae bacterium]